MKEFEWKYQYEFAWKCKFEFVWKYNSGATLQKPLWSLSSHTYILTPAVACPGVDWKYDLKEQFASNLVDLTYIELIPIDLNNNGICSPSYVITLFISYIQKICVTDKLKIKSIIMGKGSNREEWNYLNY